MRGILVMGVVTTNKDFSDRIKVSFPYDPQLVAKVKTIENYKWHKDRKYWSFPMDNLNLHKRGGE